MPRTTGAASAERRSRLRSALRLDKLAAPSPILAQDGSRIGKLVALTHSGQLVANSRPGDQVQTDGGTGTGSLGTSVATDTCGQERPLKFNSTFCEYWI